MNYLNIAWLKVRKIFFSLVKELQKKIQIVVTSVSSHCALRRCRAILFDNSHFSASLFSVVMSLYYLSISKNSVNFCLWNNTAPFLRCKNKKTPAAKKQLAFLFY